MTSGWAWRASRQIRRLDIDAGGDGPVLDRRGLRVGAADDPAERRAESLADRAIRHVHRPDDDSGPTRFDSDRTAASGRIRRSMQRPALAGMIGSDGGTLDRDTTARIRRTSAGGTPMDPTLRARMEGAFGADLGNVRVHTDAASGRIARSINAEAFTLGTHIHFADRAYAPDTSHGLHTVAHELGHVVDGADSRGGSTGGVVHRRLAYGSADLDRVTKTTSTWKKLTTTKKDPLERLRKDLKCYEKVSSFRDELFFIDIIVNDAQTFLDAHRGDPALSAQVAVVEDLWFAARAEQGKLQAKKQYLADARAGAAAASAPPGTLAASPTALQNQFGGTKQYVLDVASNLSRGVASAMPNFGADDKTLALMKANGLDEADIAAIRAYSNDDFKYVNPAVENQAWSRGKLNDLVAPADSHWHEADPARREGKIAKMQEEGRLHGGVLQAALQKLPAEHVTVMRGLSLNEASLKQRFNGTVTWGSFTSTTISRAAATAFADGNTTPFDRTVDDLHVTLVIDACEAYDLKHLSIYGDKEGEYLLAAGAKLNVVKIERQATPFPETTAAVKPERRVGVREYVRISLKQLPSTTSDPRTAAAPQKAQKAAWGGGQRSGARDMAKPWAGMAGTRPVGRARRAKS